MPDNHATIFEGLDAPADNASAVTPGATALANVTRGLWVGTPGNINVTMKGGGDVILKNVSGIIPIRVTHVLATSTTATDIVALW